MEEPDINFDISFWGVSISLRIIAAKSKALV